MKLLPAITIVPGILLIWLLGTLAAVCGLRRAEIWLDKQLSHYITRKNLPRRPQ